MWLMNLTDEARFVLAHLAANGPTRRAMLLAAARDSGLEARRIQAASERFRRHGLLESEFTQEIPSKSVWRLTQRGRALAAVEAASV